MLPHRKGCILSAHHRGGACLVEKKRDGFAGAGEDSFQRVRVERPRMTKRDALAAAVEIFGKRAAVKATKCFLYEPSAKAKEKNPDAPKMCSGFGAHERPCPGGRPLYEIGSVEGVGGIAFFVIKASGATWEKAFEKHEENKAREKAEFAVMRAKAEGKASR